MWLQHVGYSSWEQTPNFPVTLPLSHNPYNHDTEDLSASVIVFVSLLYYTTCLLSSLAEEVLFPPLSSFTVLSGKCSTACVNLLPFCLRCTTSPDLSDSSPLSVLTKCPVRYLNVPSEMSRMIWTVSYVSYSAGEAVATPNRWGHHDAALRLLWFTASTPSTSGP